jgi:hypothetical protein
MKAKYLKLALAITLFSGMLLSSLNADAFSYRDFTESRK